MLEHKLSLKEAAPIVSKCFPGYKGRRFYLELRESVTLSNTYWEGGSRAQYCAFDLGTAKAYYPQVSTDPPQFGGQLEARGVPLDPKTLIVRYQVSGTFKYVIIYAHPSAIIPSLMAGSQK